MTKEEFQEKAEKTLEVYKEDLASIRTGRANPSLVENLLVDYYGTKTPLLQMASINSPEPRQLVIQPWDKTALKEIENALSASDLNLPAVNDGEVIRIQIPSLTEERRQEFVKIVGKRLEEAKISLRSVREDYIKHLRSEQTSGNMSEDDLHMEEKELQSLVTDYQEQFSKLAQDKEKEITSIT